MKIDLVYLWVNGNDPKWIEKKAKYSTDLDLSNRESFSECRYAENDELKYSLRSVEKYAPWVNKIFIVTDNQIPSWIDTSNPKIKIIDHKEILPEKALPTFNSPVIELGLSNIPTLSEQFIFANDDMLFYTHTKPSFFFTEEGKAICRFRKRTMYYYKYKKKSDYAQTVYASILRIQKDFDKLYAITPHHSIDSYNKSTYNNCLEKYKEWVENCYPNKFRTNKDLQRCLISLYAVATGEGVFRLVNRYNRANSFFDKLKSFFTKSFSFDSKSIQINNKNYKSILKQSNPMVICMNDNQKSTDTDRLRAKNFLKSLFPDKSLFEK